MSFETPVPEQPKLSPVEGQKDASKFLRGTIALEMAAGHDHFGEADKNIIKFHGFYQQDDRDARKTRQKDGPAKLYIFMVRCKIPGGKAHGGAVPRRGRNSRASAPTAPCASRAGRASSSTASSSRDLKETIAGINADAPDHPRRVRRREPQRHVPRRRASVSALLRRRCTPSAARLAAHLAPKHGRLSRNLARRQARDRDLRARRGRADLRQGLPAAQVQDRRRASRRTTRVDVFAQDLGLLSHVENGSKLARLRPDRRRRHGHDARQREDVPLHRPSGSATSRAEQVQSRRPRRSSSCSATTATAADRQTRPASSTSSTTWGVEKLPRTSSPTYMGGPARPPPRDMPT